MATTPDPYAALRGLKFTYNPGRDITDIGENGQQYTQVAAQNGTAGWQLDGASGLGDFGGLGGYGSKYNAIQELQDGTLQMTVQRPGGGKYDTQEVYYVKGPDGGYQFAGVQDSKQTSGVAKFGRNLMEGGAFVGGVLGASYLAAQGIGAAGATGGGTSAAGGAAAGAAGGAVGSATTPALLESAIGTAGYGASSAGLGGGAAAAWGTGAGYAADAVAGGSGASSGASALSGAWNGKDFSGAAGLGGKIASGVSGMGVGDWVQLAGLGASLYTANRAQNAAEDYAAQQAALSTDWLNFSKQQYADSLPYIKSAQERALKVADSQIATMDTQNRIANETDAYNKATFRPLEQRMVADAQGYDTPQRRQSAADSALADVNMAFERQNQATARALAANGVDPGSARSMSVMGSQGIEQARQGAGAAYMARKGVEDTGYARQVNAASLGRNLPANQVAQSQSAITAGNSAVANGNSAATVGNQGAQLMGNAYAGAGNLLGSAGSLQQRADEATAQLWTQLGQAGGRLVASDVRLKTDVQPEDPEAALQQVTATPVSRWKYDPAKMAAAGIPADGAEHTGPMAQDVQAAMGDKAAPGGTKIDLITLNGKTMAAVQALDKKVTDLAALVSKGIQPQQRAA